MIDYVRDILPLQQQGVDNQTISEHLSDRTGQQMDSQSTQFTFSESGAVLIDPVLINQRTGSLIDYYQSMPDSEDKNLLSWFISEIYSGNNVNTQNYPRSIQFARIESNLPSQDLKNVAAELIQQSGGRPDAGTTEQDVIDIQAAYEQQQQIDQEMQALDNRYMTLFNQNIAPLQAEKNTSNEAWQTALNTMAANWGE